MKITFDNASRADIANSRENNINMTKAAEKTAAFSGYSITPSLDNEIEYGKSGKIAESVKTGSEVLMTSNMTDKLVVLAHNMSGEDFEEYLKNGDLNSATPKDAETILDHIKMELVKGGTTVKGFTDDLSPELQEEIKEAVKKAESLDEMTDGMKKFLVSSGKEPTIDNLYLAKYSDAGMNNNRNAAFFATEAKGYLAEKADVDSEDQLVLQIKELLTKEGSEPLKEDVEAGTWLVKNSLLLTDENIESYKKINDISLPMKEEEIRKVIDFAISEGRHPEDADVTRKESIFDEALRVTNDILNLPDSSLHATRVLEEVRLKMTAEANLLLLKSGFSIDTKNLENYVEALRKVEASIEYKESKEISEVKETIEEVKTLPLAVLGRFENINEVSLKDIKEEGRNLKTFYEEAMTKYEQLFTEVRHDLGDSIKKAFRNVDDILSDYDLETTEINRRAVRILGYNSMEITKESISKVKELDERLTKVIKTISPKDTLDLIRKGSSPVNMSIKELSDYLTDKESSDEVKMEKYSKFLYKLEKNEQISEAERKQYIDMYRLLFQLENTGYAAIGSLIKTGKELTFGNLKEAIKTTKNIGKDIKIDDSFGFLVNSLETEMMPEKIKAVDLKDDTTLFEARDLLAEAGTDIESEEAYSKEQLIKLREGLKASEESIVELISNNEPVTIGNLTAMEALLKQRGKAFKKVDEIRGKEFRKEIEEFKADFNEKDEALDSYGEMIENSKEAVFESAMEAERYIDVKELSLTHKQLSLALSLSGEETYNVPMEVAGEMTDVVLKLIHNENTEPFVAVSFETEVLGRVGARFTFEQENVNGYIACNNKESVTKLKKTADIIGENISVIHSKEIDKDMAFSKLPMKENSEKVSSVDLYKIAKKFLESIGELNED